MAEAYLGQIQAFGFNFAPRNWALCNGQTLAINQNTALFSLIGTTYGGNGQTTFQLPNLQGRLPMHQGSGQGLTPRVIGEVGGSENVTLLTTNLPQHSHALNASTQAAASDSPANNFLAAANDPATGNAFNVYGPTANTLMNPTAIGVTGSSIPFPIMPPYLVISFCIAVQGIFPSRN
jgi:microcystin-dependent protein